MKFIFAAFLIFYSTNCFSENRFENEIKYFEYLDGQHPVKPGRVLFVGSSSIRLWHKLGSDFPYISPLNRGFGGSEVTDLIYFHKRIITKYRPKKIVIYSGDNDLSSGKGPYQIADDFEKLVWIIHEKINAQIIIISIKPSPSRLYLFEKMKLTNSIVKERFIDNKRVLFIDNFNKFLDISGRPNQQLYLDDGLHMNKNGYDIWKNDLNKYL